MNDSQHDTTKPFSAQRDTHKCKRGRRVGRRELREKHLATTILEDEVAEARRDGKTAAGRPNHVPRMELIPRALPGWGPLTLHHDYVCRRIWGQYERKDLRTHEKEVAEDIDQGTQLFEDGKGK